MVYDFVVDIVDDFLGFFVFDDHSSHLGVEFTIYL
jgi:hypothetical protein